MSIFFDSVSMTIISCLRCRKWRCTCVVKTEVSSLRSAEEGVVGCLEAADLRRFLDDSCALGAIPQDVKKDFASLDPEAVPRSLMVRYLLLYVCEWLEANPRLYGRWLKVLGRYVSSQVVIHTRPVFIIFMFLVNRSAHLFLPACFCQYFQCACVNFVLAKPSAFEQ